MLYGSKAQMQKHDNASMQKRENIFMVTTCLWRKKSVKKLATIQTNTR
jgi:hypothetical protein